MWTLAVASRIEVAFQRFSDDTKQLVRDFRIWLDGLSNEERILFFVMFILVLFYMIVRRPNMNKKAGGTMRQFSVALIIVTIFGLGVGWAITDGPLDYKSFL